MDKYYTIAGYACNDHNNVSVIVYENDRMVECVGVGPDDVYYVFEALGDKYNTSSYVFF